MSITKDGKSVVCDTCGEGFEADNFQDALQQIRAGGWETYKEDNEWKQICDNCLTAYDGY